MSSPQNKTILEILSEMIAEHLDRKRDPFSDIVPPLRSGCPHWHLLAVMDFDPTTNLYKVRTFVCSVCGNSQYTSIATGHGVLSVQGLPTRENPSGV